MSKSVLNKVYTIVQNSISLPHNANDWLIIIGTKLDKKLNFWYTIFTASGISILLDSVGWNPLYKVLLPYLSTILGNYTFWISHTLIGIAIGLVLGLFINQAKNLGVKKAKKYIYKDPYIKR